MTDKKEIKMVISDELPMKDDCVIRHISGNTNRSTIHANSKNPTDTDKLQELIVEYIETDIKNSEEFIKNLVKNFNSPLRLQNCKFFRGIKSSEENKLVSNKIGPNPNPEDGRYNTQGEKCLYLIDDNINFLFEELNSLSLPILIQEYNIPIDDFKIADLSSNNTILHNSLGLAFKMTESGKTSSGYNIEKALEQRGKSKYLISQLLARYFKECDWNGLYIPGIHGKPGNHYHNLAIFDTIVDQWEQWAIGNYFQKTKT